MFLVAQGCLSMSAPLPAEADPSPAACPSVADSPATVEAAFAVDIRSREILHFTSALASLAVADQKRVFDSAMKVTGTPQEQVAETAVAATCPTLDAIYGKVRAMAVIVNRWQLRELDVKRFGELSDVVETAVDALAAGDALSPDARRQALLPFADTLPPGVPAAPALADGCAQPHRDARPVTLVQAKYPGLAASAGTQGMVEVKVSLTNTGDVRSAVLYHETLGDRLGAPELIRASILAAGTSTYAPEVSDCRPKAGTYLFRVDYRRG
jgi:hypothetical protein